MNCPDMTHMNGKAVFLKRASFVGFTDKNFKCLTEILILSVRMSDTKIQVVILLILISPFLSYNSICSNRTNTLHDCQSMLKINKYLSKWCLPISAGQCRCGRTRTCQTEFCPVWHDASSCQTECLTNFKSFQEVCKGLSLHLMTWLVDHCEIPLALQRPEVPQSPDACLS